MKNPLLDRLARSRLLLARPQPPAELDLRWLDLRHRLYAWSKVVEYPDGSTIPHHRAKSVWHRIIYRCGDTFLTCAARPHGAKAELLRKVRPHAYARYLRKLHSSLKQAFANDDRTAVIKTLRAVSHDDTQDLLCQWLCWAVNNNLTSATEVGAILRAVDWRIFGWTTGERAFDIYRAKGNIGIGGEPMEIIPVRTGYGRMDAIRSWLRRKRDDALKNFRKRAAPATC